MEFPHRERSLVTSEPRAASIVSITKGLLFTIDKKTFAKNLGGKSDIILKKHDAYLLSELWFIKRLNLSHDQLTALAEHITERNFKKHDIIMSKGSEMNACIYIVRKNGEVRVKSGNNNVKLVGVGECFGKTLTMDAMKSRDMVGIAPYTVTVCKDTVCGVLEIKNCKHLLGFVDDDEQGIVNPQAHGQEGMAKYQDQAYDYRPVEDGTELLGSKIKLQDLKKIEILGEGCFGQVWLVTDKANKESPPYALKIQAKYDLVENGRAEAAIREKNVMAKMRHPFIAKLFNTYQDDYFIYVLLEMIPGGELFSIMHEIGLERLPEDQAKFYALGICDALAYMHHGKYVFRDLKPENVLIDAKGYPVIIDFGFAKYVPDKTYTLCGKYTDSNLLHQNKYVV
jgi:Protein kinase domain